MHKREQKSSLSPQCSALQTSISSFQKSPFHLLFSAKKKEEKLFLYPMLCISNGSLSSLLGKKN
jgi:hypothetical protein